MTGARADVASLREALRRALLTLAALPDPDLRYRLGLRSAWPEIVRDMRDAYGWAPPRIRRFQPSAHDVEVFLELLAMLGWYAREFSDETPSLFRAQTFGVPMWMLQERCPTNRRRPASPNTVRNRLDGMVATIAERHAIELSILGIDVLQELHNKRSAIAESGEVLASGEADARLLPKSPKSYHAPQAEPSHPKERARDRARLVSDLERNQSRAARRRERAARAG